MRKIIKKGDIFLFILFAAAAIVIACIPILRSSGTRASQNRSSTVSPDPSLSASGDQTTDSSPAASKDAEAASGSGSQVLSDTVVISIAGETYGSWPLDEDRTIEINNDYGMNEVTIEDSTVSVTKSDCANQICVDTGKIRSPGQMIVCLPHRLIVEIQAAETQEPEYDAVVH